MIAVAGQLEGALCRSSHQLPRSERREGEGDIHCAIGGNVTGACQQLALIRRDLFQHRHNLSSRSQTRYQAGKNRA
jgi:hypothetical protein